MEKTFDFIWFHNNEKKVEIAAAADWRPTAATPAQENR